MFWHNFKYEFLQTIRQKEMIGWMMIFPIILSTLFNVAFGNLYEKDIAFNKISVAVVELQQDEIFRTVIDELSQGDDALFDTTFSNKTEAEKLLKNGDITGIIYVDNKLTLSVTGDSLMNSIIRSFLEQYESQRSIITDIAMNNPEMLQDVTQAISEEINCIDTHELTDSKMDPYASYFFNLIAMVALFGTTSGVFAATQNQGNLSAIGARKCISPTHKLSSTVSSLLAGFCAQTFCTILSITYIAFVLKVDLGDKIHMVYLSGAVGSLAGVSLGFFIGSIGRMTESAKFGIAFSASMVCCFLSGLMVAGMKPLLAQYCPIINKINPAALISDLFYCLTIYDNYRRFSGIIITLLAMSVVFTAGGFLLTRRKKYASL